MVYLAITAFFPGSWARGETADDAVKNMWKVYRRDFGSSRQAEAKRDFNVYEVGPSSTVNGMGGINYYPKEGAPKLVRRVRKGKDETLDKGEG